MTAKTGITFEELLHTICESIAPNLSKLIDTSIPPLSISSKYADTSKYPVSEPENCLWIKNHWEIADGGNFISLQCISHTLLSSFCTAMLGEELSEHVDDPESLLGLIRKLNKRFQEWLFSSISLETSGTVALESEKKTDEKPVKLNLEELRIVDDRTIRAIIEEATRNQLPFKTFVVSISVMSDELRKRFLYNMSKNRRADVRDELKRIDQSSEDAMEAQRDFAWVLIELVNKSEITIDKRLKKRLTAIVNAMDATLRKRAEEYIKSNQFGESIAAVNYVLLQLLLRRVPKNC